MKVLILTEASSASRYWEAALPLLRNKGIDAVFGTIHAVGEIHSKLENLGIEVFSLEASDSKSYPFAVYKLSKYLRNNQFDIIHASEAIGSVIAGTARLIAPKTQCIFHYHHTQVTGTQKLLSKLASTLANHVMAVSLASQKASIELDGVAPKKTSVAYNGIEPLRLVTETEKIELKSSLGIAENEKIVSIVARLRPVKGHRTLFQACEIVADAIREPLNLLVIGDGTERSALEYEASKYKNFNIRFVGNQEDIALWLSVADVIAMPSHFEPFGLVAVEAMVCGRALVASEVEGLVEIIEDGVNGLLVPSKDPDRLAAAILCVLSSPEFACNLGKNARERVFEKFTMEKMVEGWIDCYQQVSSAK